MKSSIGELARRFGLATHVLRHWESMGLLTPARDETGRRVYGEADLVRVALILIGKDAGFELREMRELLRSGNPMQHPDLLRRHVADLEQRIAAATAAKELIEEALACTLPFAECPHAQAHINARIPAG
ncbi:MerR family transcriptional regulator [Dactylosporangium sp. NPDC005572]|uniref:MerR family transcriptional regulator n=1 Tax=Dactylosporangium sp. NPDC005572 TaxID=3156889 RepID=UPI00339DF5DC